MGLKKDASPEAVENALISDRARAKSMRQGSERLLAALIANDMIARPAGRVA